MKPDSLQQLARVRRITLDQALQSLAERLRRDAEAEQSVQAIEAAIVRETERAGELDASDAVVEAFGTWFSRIRKDLHQAIASREHAQAETARARALVAAAQSALEAVTTEKERRDEAASRQAQRREQHELDEFAGRSR